MPDYACPSFPSGVPCAFLLRHPRKPWDGRLHLPYFCHYSSILLRLITFCDKKRFQSAHDYLAFEDVFTEDDGFEAYTNGEEEDEFGPEFFLWLVSGCLIAIFCCL